MAVGRLLSKPRVLRSCIREVRSCLLIHSRIGKFRDFLQALFSQFISPCLNRLTGMAPLRRGIIAPGFAVRFVLMVIQWGLPWFREWMLYVT